MGRNDAHEAFANTFWYLQVCATILVVAVRWWSQHLDRQQYRRDYLPNAPTYQ